MPSHSIDTYGELHPYLGFEWLLTNGLGGYAASTVVACNRRRYHGLLCAATNPPVGRVMALNRIGELFTFDGKADAILRTSISQFHQTFFPRGDQHLRRFELGDVVAWHYDLDGVRVAKELLVVWEKNIVGLRYTLEAEPGRAIHMQLLPFVSLRDFHALRSAANAYFQVATAQKAVNVTEGDLALFAEADGGRFVEKQDWWYRHTYAIETERGQDDTEDLFCPGSFIYEATGRGQVTLWFGIERTGLLDWDAEVARRKEAFAGKHASSVTTMSAGVEAPSKAVERLTRAADDFIVRRRQPDGSPGCTVIAGYPWFADWGRDTMISLPGLFLTTGRFDEAARVLSLFAQYVSEGMIPNRFDDYSNEPHYNTVDASLWFVHAAYEYLRLSKDTATFEKKLLPACRAIVEGYRKGTRFKIGMDPEDGLVASGDESTQLTWMDAKSGGIAFTPRQGKAVEINALWYNALKLMGMNELAAQVAASFQKKFWLSPFRGCFDVVNGDFRDGQVRPNQIFAASLPHSPLSLEQRKAVVEVVRRELLTPYGLRTLARGEPNYRGRYVGDQMSRDAAYHNGMVWPWLIGPFLDAYLTAHERSAEAVQQARIWLKPLIESMDRGCLGQIAEIFDGDEPQRPVGCFAQAWSVAEVLRLAVQLGM